MFRARYTGCKAGNGACVLAKLGGVILDREHLERVLGVGVPPGVEVSGVTHDSRRVGPGDAFVAVPGFRRDGTEFTAEAWSRGASLIVAEREVSGGPVVLVSDARAALAELSRALFGHPSGEMEIYGVTGTNGKTTTSYALHAILSRAYGTSACGLMTTVETVSGGERRPSGRTTPEAVEVQGTLAEMLQKGVSKVVMEVSSHGIALKRVSGTRFAGALFTNLSRDHLDLHGTMEEYYGTKRELFRVAEGAKLSNADDSWGRRLAGEIAGVQTFGTSEKADYRVSVVRPHRSGTAFELRHPGGLLGLVSPLLGGYNVLNVAGAAALALAAGGGGGLVAEAVRDMPQVPGRFERVTTGNRGFEVIVDYAHTDVGLAAVLEVARGAAKSGGDRGNVVCAFGAAGDRDGAKRPLMGAVAARLADRGVITTDDAYSEDPAKIAREVAAGADAARFEIILDRREAIRRVLELARPGDVVVVAGKGHERVQHLPEGDVPFHDASVIRELLEELAGEKEGEGAQGE